MAGSSLYSQRLLACQECSIEFLLTVTTPWFSSHAGRLFHLVSDYSTVTVTGSLFKRLSAYSFHCIRSIVFFFVFTTFLSLNLSRYIFTASLHLQESILHTLNVALRPYVIRKERESQLSMNPCGVSHGHEYSTAVVEEHGRP